jgi:hypothetical protein
MTGQADGKRLDPFLGDGHYARWQGRVKVGGGAAGELGFHQAVDGTKDGGEWSSRPADTVEIFEVETARAFIPQKSQVRRAELDRSCGHGSPFPIVGFGKKRSARYRRVYRMMPNL